MATETHAEVLEKAGRWAADALTSPHYPVQLNAALAIYRWAEDARDAHALRIALAQDWRRKAWTHWPWTIGACVFAVGVLVTASVDAWILCSVMAAAIVTTGVASIWLTLWARRIARDYAAQAVRHAQVCELYDKLIIQAAVIVDSPGTQIQ